VFDNKLEFWQKSLCRTDKLLIFSPTRENTWP